MLSPTKTITPTDPPRCISDEQHQSTSSSSSSSSSTSSCRSVSSKGHSEGQTDGDAFDHSSRQARSKNVMNTPTLKEYPSPINGWPQRSPMKSDHEHDVVSFTLLTQSFDTLSDTSQYIREMEGTTSNKYSSPYQPPTKIDLTLGENESFAGDISPINFDAYSTKGTRKTVNHQYYTKEDPDKAVVYHVNQGITSTCMQRYSTPQHVRHNPLYILRKVQKAFVGCSYLLPFTDVAVNVGKLSSFRLYRDESTIMNSRDIEIAIRRVETAIYAFGGYIKPKQEQQKASRRDSIFRLRNSNQIVKAQYRDLHEEAFHRRYVITSNHISWELEEYPPVDTNDFAKQHVSSGMKVKQSTDPNGETSVGTNSTQSESLSSSPDEYHQKMKYRCKLCGQLKEKHDCPYQKSLQRSIAIMVYPVVNAFTANEPASVLTKALCDMNNFVSYDANTDLSCEAQQQPSQQQPHVTPEIKSRYGYSPQSSLSTTQSLDPLMPPNCGPLSHVRHTPSRVVSGVKRNSMQLYHQDESGSGKRIYMQSFVLNREFYRAITPRTKSREYNEYNFPHVSLTFQERKRLSDTLFFLSKEMPNMAVHVANLLRISREKDEWDLSVAELLTQVVVALFCNEKDHRLDGLRDYLIRLGVAC